MPKIEVPLPEKEYERRCKDHNTFVQIEWKLRDPRAENWLIFEKVVRRSVAERFVDVHNRTDKLFEYRISPSQVMRVM